MSEGRKRKEHPSAPSELSREIREGFILFRKASPEVEGRIRSLALALRFYYHFPVCGRDGALFLSLRKCNCWKLLLLLDISICCYHCNVIIDDNDNSTRSIFILCSA